MKSLGDLLSASAARNPQKTAIAFEDRSISYESLEQATTRLAQWFLQQGGKPGDHIAFYWPNSIEAAELYFALTLSVPSPLYPNPCAIHSTKETEMLSWMHWFNRPEGHARAFRTPNIITFSRSCS
jgi:acyl-CoA synthetase (AMP-forming)/AMP-acid ligase II